MVLAGLLIYSYNESNRIAAGDSIGKVEDGEVDNDSKGNEDDTVKNPSSEVTQVKSDSKANEGELEEVNDE